MSNSSSQTVSSVLDNPRNLVQLEKKNSKNTIKPRETQSVPTLAPPFLSLSSTQPIITFPGLVLHRANIVGVRIPRLLLSKLCRIA